MLKYKSLILFVGCMLIAGTASAQQHFKIGPDWVTGLGTYVVVEEAATFAAVLADNRVLIGAALNSNDPKHAWVNRDFGTDYTVQCDVRMDSWTDGEDLSRAGIVGRMRQNPPDGAGDRGINLLFHDNINRVQFLNDLQGWGPNVDFSWDPQVWYTMVMTITGNSVSGSIYRTSEGPGGVESIDIPAWNFVNPQNRATGFVGITPSTLEGIQASFDNFQVIQGGQVVYEDGFESDSLEPQAYQIGLGPDWVTGEAGFYVVSGGVLYGIATNGVDPKHIWVDRPMSGGGAIKGDARMVSWDDTDDFSRAGFVLHLQPNGTGGGRAPDPLFGSGEDRGINMLFHENINTVEYLNDLVAWANLDDNTIPWDVRTWYTFDFRSDGFVVEGTFGPRGGAVTDNVELQPWQFPGNAARIDGYAGLTASTNAGPMAAWDNIEVRDAAGTVIFTDNFETFVSVDDWSVM